MKKRMKEVFLKPAPMEQDPSRLCMVRDPQTYRFLKEEGELKPMTTYWVRRIRMKDVVVCGAPPVDIEDNQVANDKQVTNDKKASEEKQEDSLSAADSKRKSYAHRNKKNQKTETQKTEITEGEK